MDKLNGSALARRKNCQALLDELKPLRLPQAEGSKIAGTGQDLLERNRAPCVQASPPGESGEVSELSDPGLYRGLVSIVGVSPNQYRKKYFLDQIIGIAALPEHLPADGENHPAVALKEHAQTVFAAREDAPEEICILARLRVQATNFRPEFLLLIHEKDRLRILTPSLRYWQAGRISIDSGDNVHREMKRTTKKNRRGVKTFDLLDAILHRKRILNDKFSNDLWHAAPVLQGFWRSCAAKSLSGSTEVDLENKAKTGLSVQSILLVD